MALPGMITSRLPAECKEANWIVDTMTATVPYRGIEEEENVITIQPLAAGPAEASLLTTLDEDTVGGISYDSEDEGEIWTRWNHQAAILANNTAGYHPAVKDQLVEIASLAGDRLRNIQLIYQQFEDKVYKAKDASGLPIKYPLSVPETTIEAEGRIVPVVGWAVQRKNAREAIRSMYADAGDLIWCALYGKGQSESYNLNRDEWNARAQASGGMVVTGGSGQTWDPSSGWGGTTGHTGSTGVDTGAISGGTTTGTGTTNGNGTTTNGNGATNGTGTAGTANGNGAATPPKKKSSNMPILIGGAAIAVLAFSKKKR